MKTILRRIIANFVFPVENKPGLLQLVTRIVPATYFLSISSMDYICEISGCKRP
jgi:hypothetical protein